MYHRKKEVYRLLSATPTDRQKRGEGFPTKNLPLVTKSALFVPKTKHNRQESPVNKLFSVRVTKHCRGASALTSVTQNPERFVLKGFSRHCRHPPTALRFFCAVNIFRDEYL